MEHVRLNRFLSLAGLGARRKCDLLVEAGRVRVNGETVERHGLVVRPGRDSVEVDGRPVRLPASFIYLLFHKPPGVLVTMSDPFGRLKVPDLLPDFTGRVFPVGRLDMDTSGALVLTGDGPLAHRLIHPSYKVPKVYRVEVEGRFTAADCRALARGVTLEEGLARAENVRVVAQTTGGTGIELTLTQGWKRQIRRMVKALGRRVLSLHRLSFGGIDLTGLPQGSFRPLDEAEIGNLRALVGL